ncbi:MAG: alpha/beta hydrolase [Opitutus sp.]|nr:alpha/beta hydrolase [Opitutus sp.]
MTRIRSMVGRDRWARRMFGLRVDHGASSGRALPKALCSPAPIRPRSRATNHRRMLGLRRVIACAVVVIATLAPCAAEHRVQPKTSVDHPQFAIRSLVLGDGAILAYYVRPGAAGQPMLVLVPETHGDRSQFFEPSFLEKLPVSLGLVVIESRGQGRSWPPPTPAQAKIERYASDVLEVVGVLRPPAWFVGGHSLGGMIAIEIAGRKPAGLRGVIALEGWAHSRVQRAAFPEITPRTEAQRVDARAQREERYRTQRWSADEVAALGQAWTKWTGGETILRETTYPVLSVWGDRGRAVRPSREELLLPDRSNVDLVWIAGSDHYVTDPPYAAEVGAAIAAFVARHSPR